MEIQQPLSNQSAIKGCEYSCKGNRCGKPVVEESLFCEKHTNDKEVDLEIYKAVRIRFLQQVQGFWTRSNFYFLIQAGLLTVFVGTFTSRYSSSLDFVIGFLGILFAGIWFVAAYLDARHLNAWRGQLVKIDKVVDRRQHLAEIEEPVINQLTPSKLTILYSLAFVFGWIVLLITFFRSI